MICMQWVVFFFNLVIMMIVMSNFVIAVVSHSYDASMAEEEVIKYTMRSEMNFEMMRHNNMKQPKTDEDRLLGFCIISKADRSSEKDNSSMYSKIKTDSRKAAQATQKLLREQSDDLKTMLEAQETRMTELNKK